MNKPTEPIQLRVTSACPSCQERYVVDVMEVFEPKPPGTYSIAGAQPKVIGTYTWKYRCTACGAMGDALQSRDTFLPRATCGHHAATDHYPVGGEHKDCPGCCPVCIAHHKTEKK